MPNSTLVGIILLNWNDVANTTACLRSLQALSATVPHRIYVVDNASQRESPAPIRDGFPEITFIQRSTNDGYAAGNNDGMRQAFADGCSHALLLNNDTEVEPTLLDALVDCYALSPDIGLVVPLIVDHETPDRVQYAGGDLILWRALSRHRGYGQPVPQVSLAPAEVSFCTGTALCIHRDLYQAIGGLEESYFLYHEDSDYSIRAARAGFTLYYTGATKILHKTSAASGGYMNANSFYYSIRNGIHLIRRFGSTWDRSRYCLFTLFYFCPGVIAYSILKGRLDLLRAYTDGITDGIRHRTGPRS